MSKPPSQSDGSDSHESTKTALADGDTLKIRLEEAKSIAPTLVVISGRPLGKSFYLTQEKMVLGRDLAADISIAETAISRKHTEFFLSPQGVQVKDLGSTNGTFINDIKLAKDILQLQNTFNFPSRKVLLKKALISTFKNILTHRFLFGIFVYPLVFIAAFFKLKLLSNFVGKRSNVLLNELPEEWFSKLSSQQAKFGLKMLDKIEIRNKKRISIALNYSKLSTFIGSDVGGPSFSIFWQTVFLATDVNKVRLYLATKGIDCSRTSLVLISSLPFDNNQSEFLTPQARLIFDKGIYFPCYHQLTKREVKKINKNIKHLKNKKLLL